MSKICVSKTCQLDSVRFLSRSAAWVGMCRSAAALVVSSTLVIAPAIGEAPAGVGSDQAQTQHAQTQPAQTQRQQRVAQALDRFTFGARPGEAAAVQQMGLKQWFALQLEPSRIDDSVLESRLAAYPAVQLSIADLEQKYPSPAMVRGMADGRIPLPQEAAARALATDQIAFYRDRIASKGKMEPAASMNQPGTPAGMAKETGGRIADAPQNASDPTISMLLGLPPGQRLATILAMPPGQVLLLRQSLRGPAAQRLAAGMTAEQRETLRALGGSERMIASEAMETRLLRDVYSRRELEAVMTDFWLNHFNVYVRKNQNEPYLIPSYERTVRAHALGKFEDLLDATAESPAMLEYLDNFRSIGPDSQAARRVDLARQRNPNGLMAKNASAGLNENYARELMELHTLGVDGGYTQADVTEVAKVFTGWTVDKPVQGGEFQFDERRHEPGTKLVLGKKIKESGQKEGLEVLHMLATSPATAHFLSQELAVRFVSDDPPPALVDRMAATFLSSHGDIKSVLRTLFDAPEFWSPAVYRAKVKTPEEFVFSAVRAGGVEVENPAPMVQALARLGMPLYGMQTPNGYSWTKDGWVSTGALVSRMNFALVLSGDRIPGSRTDWEQVVGEGGAVAANRPAAAQIQTAAYTQGLGPEGSAAKELRLEQALLDSPASSRTRAAVLEEAADPAVTDQAETQFNLRGQTRETAAAQSSPDGHAGDVRPKPRDQSAAIMAGLLLGSPEFQRR